MSNEKLSESRTSFLMTLGDVQSIEGMILTVIDSLGLESQQGNAVKSLVRQAIWDEVHKPYRIWVTDQMYDDAHKEWSQYQGHGFNHAGARPYGKKQSK